MEYRRGDDRPVTFMKESTTVDIYYFKMARRKHSYTVEFKLSVLAAAKGIGNRAAGRKFNVHESLIRRWKKIPENLIPVKRRTERRGIARYPQLDSVLFDYIAKRREKGFFVSNIRLKIKALSLAKKLNIPNFNASRSWQCRFMKRNHVSAYRKLKRLNETSHNNKEKKKNKKNDKITRRDHYKD